MLPNVFKWTDKMKTKINDATSVETGNHSSNTWLSFRNLLGLGEPSKKQNPNHGRNSAKKYLASFFFWWFLFFLGALSFFYSLKFHERRSQIWLPRTKCRLHGQRSADEEEFNEGYLEGGLGLDLAVGNLFFTCLILVRQIFRPFTRNLISPWLRFLVFKSSETKSLLPFL